MGEMRVKHALAVAAVMGWLVGGAPALAAERTVTLKVDNMTCVTCLYIVRASLAEVPGVSKVEVSFDDEIAVVTYDDTTANLAALVAATAKFGFPSQPVSRAN